MKISLISSLYRTDTHIKKWQKRILRVSKKLIADKIDFEIIAIANDPTELEKSILADLAQHPWFKLHIVDRESLYASWNRGVGLASGEVCGFWNVDDLRFASAIKDGIQKIETGAELVYFPFIYKRYVLIGKFPLLAKIKIFTPPEFERTEFMRAMHCGPFFVFSKKLFERIGGFDDSYKIAGDYEWCVRAATVALFKKSKVIAGIFRNDGTTLSGSKNSLHKVENDRIKTEYELKS